MKLELRDVLMRGKWYKEEDSEYEVEYWLEKSSLQLFYTENLIEEFGYKNCDEIKKSGHFIPFFKTDIIALQKKFIENYPDKAVEETMNDIIKNDNYGYNSGYDVAFRILTQDYAEFRKFSDDYYDFEKKQLLKDAEQWCKENNIPYYTENDSERKLDLRNTLLYAFGGECDDGEGGWKPFTFWFCRADFRILDPADISVYYGYENDEDIAASGLFIPLFKVNDEDMDYDDSVVLKIAEQWAVENNIPYYISRDRPDHLGSQFEETEI